jgi:hypothetical protein
MAETRNLGQIAAIYIGTIPPVNLKLIWYDDNEGVKAHKYYDVITETWENLCPDPMESNNYRMNQYSINGSTDVVFTSEMSSSDYYVTVKEFISNAGVSIKSGWTITNQLVGGFTFTPPSRYLIGVLVYEAKLYK